MNSLNKRESAPIENSTIEARMGHRTIRASTDEPLAEDELTTPYEVARHTASSSFLQQTTIIRVTNPVVRERLHAASGRLYMSGARGELPAFVADQYRNSRIREEDGVDNAPLHRTNLLLIAPHDALLAARSVVAAVESMGLGTCYLGSIHVDPRAVIEAPGLPGLTFPVLDPLVGHPDQEPQSKPRLPLPVVVAENSYPKVDSYSELITDYDEIITDYYDMRNTSKRTESFSTLVRTTIGVAGARVSPILEVLNEQGLALG